MCFRLPEETEGRILSFRDGSPLPYSQQPNARWRVVTRGILCDTADSASFRTILLNGRDTATAPPVLLINETMARQYWPDENPIGKRISISGEKEILEIVGMVGDVKHYSLAGETRPEMYFPYAQQAEGFMSVVIRTASLAGESDWSCPQSVPGSNTKINR